MTFAQIKDLGGSVKKGEKGTPVIFFKTITKKKKDSDEQESFPMMKMYFVFNMNQTTITMEEETPSASKREEYLRAKDIVENFSS